MPCRNRQDHRWGDVPGGVCCRVCGVVIPNPRPVSKTPRTVPHFADVPCDRGYASHDLSRFRGKHGHKCLRCGVWFADAAGYVWSPRGSVHRKPQSSRHDTLRARDGNRCAYCERVEGTCGWLTIDHVVPKSRGGPDALTNCVLACGRCNSEKGDLLLSEWVDRWYHREPPHAGVAQQARAQPSQG